MLVPTSPQHNIPKAPSPPPVSPVCLKTPESNDVNHPDYSDDVPSSTRTDDGNTPHYNVELHPSISKELRNLASASKLPVVAVSLVPDHIPYWCKKTKKTRSSTDSRCGALTYFPGELQDRVYYGFEGEESKFPPLKELPNGDVEGKYVERATKYFIAIGLGNSLARKQQGALLRWESERAGAMKGAWTGCGLMELANQTVPFQRNMDRVWREARAAHFAAQSLLGGKRDDVQNGVAYNNNALSGTPTDVPGVSLASQFFQERSEDIEMASTSTPTKQWPTTPLSDSLSTAFNDDPIFLTAPPITVPSSPGAFPVISTIASSSKTIFLDAPPGEFESVVETYVHLDDGDIDISDNRFLDSTAAHWQNSRTTPAL